MRSDYAGDRSSLRIQRAPQRATPARSAALVAAAAIALAAAYAVEHLVGESRPPGRAPTSDLSLRAEGAVEVMRQASDLLRTEKIRSGLGDLEGVPRSSRGFVGAELTPLVTTLGSLDAKVLATRPDWASALTFAMADHGIAKGDLVAASFSGSFPALDLAVIVACHALGADLIAVSSVTASTWGATEAGFTWPEIEARLARRGLISPVTRAVSIGGCDDRGADLTPEALETARQIQQAAATDLGATVLSPEDLADAVSQRLVILRSDPCHRRPALYVSVGGNHASLGGSPAVLRLRNGFIPAEPFDLSPERGVVARFAETGTPVLMLLNINELAVRWGVGHAHPTSHASKGRTLRVASPIP